MRVVDEKGKLFGKLNIIDLLVIFILIAAVVLLGYKVLKKDGSMNANYKVLTYTVLVKGVEPQVYDGIKAYIPTDGTGDQLMANGEMLDAWAVDVTSVPHDNGLTMTDVSGQKLTFPVQDDTLDLTFTIKANVVNTVTNEVGTQEVRIGKGHIVKTIHFELANGIITSCQWQDSAT